MNTATNGLPTPMSHLQNKQDVVKDVQAAPDCLLFGPSPDEFSVTRGVTGHELATHEPGVADADSSRLLGARLGCRFAAVLLTHPWVSAFTVEPFGSRFPDGEKRFFPTYVDPDSIEYVAGAPTPSALEMARGGRGYARGSRLIEEVVADGSFRLRIATTRFGIGVFHVSRAKVAHLLAAEHPISGWDIFAALCPEQASAIEAQRASAVKSVRVVVETCSTNDDGGSSKFASFVVDRQFLAKLRAAFDQAADGETIFPGASDDLRQTYEDALAEQGDPGANTRDRGPTG
jgi:hypothetical protein